MKAVSLYYSLSDIRSSHALRLTALSDYLNVPISDIVCGIRSGGKPYLISHPSVHFSVSHSGKAWICTVSDCEVGCDIQEYPKNIARLPTLAKRWFSEAELELFNRNECTPRIFADIWSRKEAYLKLTGEGLSTISTLDTTRIPTITPFTLLPTHAGAIAVFKDEIRIEYIKL